MLHRFYGQRIKNTEWIPGMDHAGLATHEKITAHFNSSEYSNEEYFQCAKSWCAQRSTTIMEQFTQLGIIPDWSRMQWTLDDNFKMASFHALRAFEATGKLTCDAKGLWLNLDQESAELARAIRAGEIKIYPETHAGRLLNMLDNNRPWELSRNIPWGLQLPLLINKQTGTWRIANPEDADENEYQSEWRADTWLTSGLWPLAINNWPNNKESCKLDLLETGYDIIYFWAARMLMLGKALTGEWLFNDIYLHGLIRDSQGRKFSKSLGNGIDPRDIIKEYGADSLRLYCARFSMPGKDFKINMADLGKARADLQKIYSAARYLFKHTGKIGFESNKTDKNIPKEFYDMRERFEGHIKEYKFKQAADTWIEHIRDDFCTRYLSSINPDLELANLWFKQIIKLGMPICPHLCGFLLHS